MKKTLAVLVTAVLALGLTSCGGNDDEAASKALSDSIMKSQDSSNASQFFAMKRKDADCIGDGMVDEIGTDQLQEYGMITKDNKANKDVTAVKMSTGDAESATDVLFDCTDVPTMMQKAVGDSGQIPAEMQDCVNKALNEENLRSMFTKVFSGKQEEAQQELIQPMMKCQSGG
jgi:hypothetical protein